MSRWLENAGPGLIEDVYFLSKMGDIPASYVIVYQRVYFLGLEVQLMVWVVGLGPGGLDSWNPRK